MGHLALEIRISVLPTKANVRGVSRARLRAQVGEPNPSKRGGRSTGISSVQDSEVRLRCQRSEQHRRALPIIVAHLRPRCTLGGAPFIRVSSESFCPSGAGGFPQVFRFRGEPVLLSAASEHRTGSQTPPSNCLALRVGRPAVGHDWTFAQDAESGLRGY